MQPYFFPYIGYFQLVSAVDLFIVYDNIKYTKKGWINRNRLLMNGGDVVFSLPLKGDSDSLDVRDRELSGDFDRSKLLNQIRAAYRRAPFFTETIELVEVIVRFDERNLYRFVQNSIFKVCQHIGIATMLVTSSEIDIDHGLRSQEKVLALCDAVGAATYINAIGGTALYSREDFRVRGFDLQFIQPKRLEYPQYGNEFVPWLSIIDVMMFCPPGTIREYLHTGFDLQ